MDIVLGTATTCDDERWARIGPIHCWDCHTRTRKWVMVEIDGVSGVPYCPRCTGQLAAEADTVTRR